MALEAAGILAAAEGLDGAFDRVAFEPAGIVNGEFFLAKSAADFTHDRERHLIVDKPAVANRRSPQAVFDGAGQLVVFPLQSDRRFHTPTISDFGFELPSASRIVGKSSERECENRGDRHSECTDMVLHRG